MKARTFDEWWGTDNRDGDYGCPECKEWEDLTGHASDCNLAKLIEGVE